MTAPETRSAWQIEQAKKCGCRGSDEYCPCQNTNSTTPARAEAPPDDLRTACKAVLDDYQTSDAHHPDHVLIRRTDFERIKALVEAPVAARAEAQDEGAAGIVTAKGGQWEPHTGQDYAVVMLPDENTETASIHVYGDDEGLPQRIADAALRPQPSGETREAVARELAEERMSADKAAHNECGTTPYDQTIDDFMPDALAFVDRILALLRPAAPDGGGLADLAARVTAEVKRGADGSHVQALGALSNIEAMVRSAIPARKGARDDLR